MREEQFEYSQEDFDRGEPIETPANSPKESPDKTIKAINRLNKMVEEKFSIFESSSQENLAFIENVARDLKNSSSNLESAAKNYSTNVDRFNKPHISFRDLPLKTKALLSTGFAGILALGLTFGIIVQEKLSIYDPSGGWNKYVIQAHLANIKECSYQAHKAGKVMNCNIIEKP